jgi:hypothetical protein
MEMTGHFLALGTKARCHFASRVIPGILALIGRRGQSCGPCRWFGGTRHQTALEVDGNCLFFSLENNLYEQLLLAPVAYDRCSSFVVQICVVSAWKLIRRQRANSCLCRAGHFAFCIFIMTLWPHPQTSHLLHSPVSTKGVSLYCIVLYCIVLYCIVFHCIVFHCIVMYNVLFIVTFCFLLYFKQKQMPVIYSVINNICK